MKEKVTIGENFLNIACKVFIKNSNMSHLVTCDYGSTSINSSTRQERGKCMFVLKIVTFSLYNYKQSNEYIFF